MQIESYEHDGYRIIIDTDDNAWDPRDADNATVMVCWHRRYNLGDTNDEATEIKAKIDGHDDYWHTNKRATAITRWLRIFYGATVVQPLYLLDHSGISMSTSKSPFDPGGWDTSMVGFVFDTERTREVTGVTEENVPEAIEAEVRAYTTYLEGGYVMWTVLDHRGDVIESGGGYESLSACKEDAEANVPATPDILLTDAEALDDIARLIGAGMVTDLRVPGIIKRTGRVLTP